MKKTRPREVHRGALKWISDRAGVEPNLDLSASKTGATLPHPNLSLVQKGKKLEQPLSVLVRPGTHPTQASLLPSHPLRAISLLRVPWALLSHQRNSFHPPKPTSRLNSCSALEIHYISSSPYQALSQLNFWPCHLCPPVWQFPKFVSFFGFWYINI